MKIDPAALAMFTATFSVACVLAWALRRPLRRLGGATTAYGAWGLVPACLLGWALPAPQLRVPPVGESVLAPARTLLAPAVAAGASHAVVLPVLWALGALACLAWQAHAQRRFVRAMGRLQRVPWAGLPVYRAECDPGLPALVGLLRPRIVLPPDFQVRYAAAQRTLLLRHELVHWQRGDLPCNALAALLLCLQWFNPLAYLALAAYRRDQEMACDARVLQRRPRQRRAYADAMLVGALDVAGPPLGCPWPSRHPLKERLRMLQSSTPRRVPRVIATMSVVLLAMAGSYGAWASRATTPDAPAAAAASHVVPASSEPIARDQVPAPGVPSMAPPRYPAVAVAQGVSGQVMLRVAVRADGSVSDVVVEASQPEGVFDEASVAAARQWRFRPALRDGRPVASQVRVPVTFELHAADAQAPARPSMAVR